MPQVRGGLNDGSRLTTEQNRRLAENNIPHLNNEQRQIFRLITDLSLISITIPIMIIVILLMVQLALENPSYYQ
jgi:hypothetical protein